MEKQIGGYIIAYGIIIFLVLCGLVAVAIAGSIAVIFLLKFRKNKKETYHNDALPVETVKATVLQSYYHIAIRRKGSKIPVIFETEKGIMKFNYYNFQTPPPSIKALQKGDAGILHYQGTQYIDFIKEEKELITESR